MINIKYNIVINCFKAADMNNIDNQLIFVEKKEDYDSESQHLLNDIVNNLKIKSLKNIRVINRYQVFNVSDEIIEKSKNLIFAEPMVDHIYLNKFPMKKNETAFAVQPLPGQFDQRASSARQCLMLIDPNTQAEVISAKVIVLEGKISKNDLERIKKYYINPIDSFETELFPNDKPNFSSSVKNIKILDGFINFDNNKISELHKSLGLSMTIEDFKLIRSYFKKEKRDPFITEIKVIDTYWSDHCRHTTFETKITNVEIEKGPYQKLIQSAYEQYQSCRNEVYGSKANERKISLMDIATIGAKYFKKTGLLDDLDVSDEINACSLKIDVTIGSKKEKYLLMFKNETHNHPTEIEPFGGAATCLGGAIRDPLSGRSYVYQAMRITGCADPTVSIDSTIEGKLPQAVITKTAAAGYSSYGNQIGLATGQVDEVYHPNYVAKRLETGAVIAAAPIANVVRKTPKPGDVVILLGGRTGRDGIGGATGSSKVHEKTSILTCGSQVQKGNPVEERKIQRFFKNPTVSKMIIRCNDFGAGGVSVAIGELCDGIEINLNAIPKKYQNLDGTELAISESQERMAVVLEKANAKKFIQLALEENLEATIVAKVTKTPRLKMIWNEEAIVDIKREFLNTNGALQETKVCVTDPKLFSKKTDISNLENKWLNMLTDLNVTVKSGLIQRFDSTIGANTVLMPLGGINQLTPAEGMASKIATFKPNTKTCSLMTYGFNPYIGMWSPFHMGYYSVIESLTKIVAMGGEYNKVRLSCQEFFERLKDDANRWGKPFAALLGALKAQLDFSVPSIGGKDSMSGTFENIDVPPTLISFAVTTSETKNIISPEFKRANSDVVLFTPKYTEDGMIDQKSLIKNFKLISKLIKQNVIVSAFSLKQKGIAEAISKMCIGNDIGFAGNENINPSELFKMNYGSIVAEVVDPEKLQEILNNSTSINIGKTTKDRIISIKNLDISIELDEVKELITKKLRNVFDYKTNILNKKAIDAPLYVNDKPLRSPVRIKEPKVVIPVFPGTNCEFDSQLAFEKAGAIVKQVLIKDLNKDLLLKSINELADTIDESQILMIPGGFSAGDEPDGSAKFIVNIFKNQLVKDAVHRLIARKGLILGICNGFQALIKLGLVPYGKIMDAVETMPTLTYNDIHHHVSELVRTKLISNKSPWFSLLTPGSINTVPISHGEGKLVCDKKLLKQLLKSGQIPTQYVDLSGSSTMAMPFNPNGSVSAIESMTNEDGTILGKMAHSERIGEHLYKNVNGEFDQKIFEAGVRYFNWGKK